jgi:hypothetical protein
VKAIIENGVRVFLIGGMEKEKERDLFRVTC